MENKHWKIAGLVLVLLTSALVAGCSNSSKPNKTHDPQVASGQLIHLYLLDEPPSLDPSKATDAESFKVLAQISEGLTRLDKNGQAIPGVAERWEMSADGKTYTFHLRADAKWSDGSPVTAKDFEYSWKRTLSPKTRSQYAFMVAWIKGGNAYNLGRATEDQVGVKATDDHTLVVQLEAPIPFLPAQLAFPCFYPEKQAWVEKWGDKFATDSDKMLSDGPFQITDWQHDQTMELAKNDNYWDKGQVKLERVTFQIAKDASTLENLYESGQLDRIRLVRDQVDRYRKSPEYGTVGELTNGYLEFNEKRPLFQSAKVRRAFTYALDGNQYADVIYHSGSVGATGLVPLGTSDGMGGDFRKDNGDLMHNKENLPQAKQLLLEGLHEAGFSQLPKVKVLYVDGDLGKKATELLKEQWRKNLGVEVEIENLPFKLKLKRTTDRDYDIVLSLWGADYNDPMTFLDMWVTNGDFNESDYSNPHYDELIHSAKAEPDPKTRMEKLLEAEKVLLADMPVGPLFFRGTAVLTKPYVKGWVDQYNGSAFDLKGVYIDGKK